MALDFKEVLVFIAAEQLLEAQARGSKSGDTIDVVVPDGVHLTIHPAKVACDIAEIKLRVR